MWDGLCVGGTVRQGRTMCVGGNVGTAWVRERGERTVCVCVSVFVWEEVKGCEALRG